jgi:tetratricopeptide (TPR) repeat protein
MEIDEAISEGNKAREANNYQKAFANYLKVAEQLDPKDPRAVYGIGTVYSDLACNDKAIQSFTEALKLDRNFYDALIALGYSYAANERYEEAEAQFQAVLKKTPGDARAKIGLAYIATKKKQYDAAINQLKLIVSTGPTSL